jgi:type I restriction enzyme M protein
MAFESSFKAIDNTLHHDDGCSTALDYVEQSSWVLFLKYLDDLELTREQAAELEDKAYTRIISGEYQWHEWAMPLDANGEYDRARALVGDDLIDFVNQRLFPYLQGFKERFDVDTIEYKVGVIFTEIKNKISSGYNLRDVIERIDELKFQTADNRHEMTQIYEDRLRQMGNAGRNGGEYYTPRPLIRTIVKSVNPQVGETVYDGACGSAGFLCEAYSYMHSKPGLTSSEEEILQTKTFYGKELKGLAYIIAMMNMILHGVQSPNIVRTNTLSENLANIQPSDQKDVVLANPPFGGSERDEVQQNFPIKSSETAYMFLQHFIKMMKAGGRAGIVIKNTFLSNGDATALRRKLLDECNLHTVLDLPSGVFTGAGVKTVVLFFTKGEPTQKIWYYQIDKHFTKTQPMTEADLADFLAKQKTREDSEYSWTIDASELGDDLDLSVKNPHKVEEVDERTPQEVFDNILSLGCEAGEIMDTIQEEFWKDDIDDVFGFVDEDSDDYIIHHRFTEEEKAEYHALLEQVDELQEKFFEASPEDQDRLRLEIRELYGKAEDLVNKYKKDDESSEEDEA